MTTPDSPARAVAVKSTIDEYLARADWRINANANQGYSLGGMILNSAGKLIANYWLDEVYAAEAGTAHRDGDLHIHDLDVFAGYCAGGRCGWCSSRGSTASPASLQHSPKHLSSALGQLVNFLGTLQNEWAGAQAFSSFDTYLAPYVRLDGLTDAQVHQAMQEFVYNLNVPSRWGTQTPFTNLTFDWVCPDDLRDQHPLVGYEVQPFTYGDLAPEMAMINRAFIDVLTAGDADGRAFTFPIPTYNITKDFDWDGENVDALLAMTAKYGLPYFQNFLNSDLDPHMIRSMCCRLQLDLTELLKRGNGLFGSAEQTGSIGVVTINCARLGFLAAGMKAPPSPAWTNCSRSRATASKPSALSRAASPAASSPTRCAISAPSTTTSETIGVNGLNEYVRNLTRDAEDITTDAGPSRCACSITCAPGSRSSSSRPATCTTWRRAPPKAPPTASRKRTSPGSPRAAAPGGIRHAGTTANPYYTNSSQLPVGYTSDPFLAMAIQEPLQQKYTGGTVQHLYLGEAMESASACRELVRRSLERFRLPYLTITPTFSICPQHGYVSGHHETCPTCAAACEVWTRVMGYFRPIAGYNIGKKGEAQERRYFVTPTAQEESWSAPLQPVS